MFTFTNYSSIYLHCKVHLCLLRHNNCTSHCYPGYHTRVARDISHHDSAAISLGPLVQKPDERKQSSASGLWTSVVTLMFGFHHLHQEILPSHFLLLIHQSILNTRPCLKKGESAASGRRNLEWEEENGIQEHRDECQSIWFSVCQTDTVTLLVKLNRRGHSPYCGGGMA
ncbi:hypothetical protein F2P81_022297 [Scophthalmus maximus]|uniref:ZP domain-containing protein n=1 Tax=Scophthalmus maximus TaxID=52904 RepID=A0A6A4RRY8_SCOMX|nr:hypothetical protein F2P81_022297 [Scophthalmus maximus]